MLTSFAVSTFVAVPGILLGITFGLTGFALALFSIETWARASLGALDPVTMMRIAIPSVTLMLAGAEILFSSFLLSLIDVRPAR